MGDSDGSNAPSSLSEQVRIQLLAYHLGCMSKISRSVTQAETNIKALRRDSDADLNKYQATIQSTGNSVNQDCLAAVKDDIRQFQQYKTMIPNELEQMDANIIYTTGLQQVNTAAAAMLHRVRSLQDASASGRLVLGDWTVVDDVEKGIADMNQETVNGLCELYGVDHQLAVSAVRE